MAGPVLAVLFVTVLGSGLRAQPEDPWPARRARLAEDPAGVWAEIRASEDLRTFEGMNADHLLVAVEAAGRAGEWVIAQRLVDRAARLRPKDPQVLLWMGHVAMAQVDEALARQRPGVLVGATLVDAATFYRRSREEGGDAYLTALNESEAWWRAARYPRAEAAAEIALEARPGDRRAGVWAVRVRLDHAAQLAVDTGPSLTGPAESDQEIEERRRAAAARRAEVLEAARTRLLGLATVLPADAEIARLQLRLALMAGGNDRESHRALFRDLCVRVRDDRELWSLFWNHYFEREARGGGQHAQQVGTSANLYLRRAAQDVLEADPEARLAHWHLGFLDENQGRPADALRHYRRYAALDPKDPSGPFHLGVCLRKMDRLREARAALVRAQEMGGVPFEALGQAFGELIQAHYDRGEMEAALELQDRVLAFDRSASARRNRAALLVQAGRVEEGIRAYESLLLGSDLEPPERAVAENNLALALWGTGRHEKAIARLGSALESDPDNLDARENRGIFHVKLGQVPKALADLNEVCRRDPTRKRARYWRMKLERPALVGIR